MRKRKGLDIAWAFLLHHHSKSRHKSGWRFIPDFGVFGGDVLKEQALGGVRRCN
ncbi:MAG: hypothetical protein N3B10_10655 [Armatimonadetes bacterium]|nr:hypothetical protein [Armatimonadota bacterium]MCX7968926.1 hypothetical protein [Armatimonadota bacterium]MDW8144082.1 hypothetical protein [Armatimonadota bacterium]